MSAFRRGVTTHADPSPGEAESARIAYVSTATHREQVDALMRQHPDGLTMHEVADLLGWNSRDNVNPRMQELKHDGLVYKPGSTRDTGLGGRADVWRHTSFVQPDRFVRTRTVPKSEVAPIPPARQRQPDRASSKGKVRYSEEEKARLRQQIERQKARREQGGT